MGYLDEKAAALLELAKAYEARNEGIQYDQLSMDRLVRVTPRRDRYAPPEAATTQHRLFLDCSGFICALFYQCFGYKLEADNTWQMMEVVKPRIYDLALTEEKKAEQRAAIPKEILTLLAPGDVLVETFTSNGHVMLYDGAGQVYHVSQHGAKKSYDYEKQQDTFTEGGSCYHDSLDILFEDKGGQYGGMYSLFSPETKRFCILRPLDRMGAPRPSAKGRLGEGRALYCSVYSSHPGGNTAERGATVTYTVEVKNQMEAGRWITVCLTPTADMRLLSAAKVTFAAEGGEKRRVSFSLEIAENAKGPYSEAPQITVNEVDIWAERILIAEPGCAARGAKAAAILARRMKQQADRGEIQPFAVMREAWQTAGKTLPREATQILHRCFHRYDAKEADVLWRVPQQPEKDMAVYGYFGGFGVITPEVGVETLCRTKRITLADLLPGDLLICSDDHYYTQQYVQMVTETGLIGAFAAGESISVRTGEAAQQFIDSLPGRFCYIVIRPGLLKEQ